MMASKICFFHTSTIWALFPIILVLLIPLLSESRSTPPSHTPFEFIKNLQGCHKGEKVQDVHLLKQHLEKFGYLNPTTTVSTTTTTNHKSISNNSYDDDDSFDDLLESAIKDYQLNYHLKVTGELDAATVEQMMKPRCGVPDIAPHNKTSSGNGRHLGSMHFHNVQHYKFFPGAPRWPPNKRSLTYAFLPNGVQAVSSQAMRSACANAFARWASASDFRFQEISDADSADLKIGFFSGDHGDGGAFDGYQGTLAHAFAPTRGWLHFDADEKWTTSSLNSNYLDLESVAVHEIGHLLGLSHSQYQDAIMYAYFQYGAKKVTLTNDDINGIQALYP